MASEYNDLLEEDDESQTLDEDKPVAYQPPEISPYQSQTFKKTNLEPSQYIEQPALNSVPSVLQDTLVLTEKLAENCVVFLGTSK